MKITDYKIDIKDSSFQDRLRLRQVLLDNNQVISGSEPLVFTASCNEAKVYYWDEIINKWVFIKKDKGTNISLQDFITKFKKHDQIRNLAIYKRSGEPWTQNEFSNLCKFLLPNQPKHVYPTVDATYNTKFNKYFYDDGTLRPYHAWSSQNKSNFKNCLQIAYEDLFPQEQPINQNPFKIGDRIRCITFDNPIDNPYDSEWTVIKTYGTDVYYKDGFATHYKNFELVQSAESKISNTILPKTKYPIFVVNKPLGFLFKYTGHKEGIWLTTTGISTNPGEYCSQMVAHTHSNWKPCDFTIEPEIFDIDWWDARFEAGLPVGYCNNEGSTKEWSITINSCLPSNYVKYDKPGTFKFYIPSCQDNVEANTTSNPTQKEQTMTIQQLLNKLFGAAMPTDYDRRPAYLVVAYNRDGSEMGTATANTIKQVKDKVADTPDLWGCKVLVYKLDKEVSVVVPVKATAATVAEPVKDEE